jgi:hypothetical protein
MSYVKVTNGALEAYPYTTIKLRRDNPNTSFPKSMSDELLQQWGVYAVSVSDAPDIDARTQTVSQNAEPSLVDDVWTLGWTISSKTAEEIQEYDTAMAAKARSKRNELLSQTDYFALTDVTMDAAMTSYRQALRDITTHANWPYLNDEDWPTKPE